MNKTYWVFIVVLAALAIWGTERAMAQTTTILGYGSNYDYTSTRWLCNCLSGW